MSDSHQDQIRKNYEAFAKKLPTLSEEQRGKFALMRDQEIIAFFDTAADASIAGGKLYQDGLFSVQEVTGSSINLGFYSYALD